MLHKARQVFERPRTKGVVRAERRRKQLEKLDKIFHSAPHRRNEKFRPHLDASRVLMRYSGALGDEIDFVPFGSRCLIALFIQGMKLTPITETANAHTYNRMTKERRDLF